MLRGQGDTSLVLQLQYLEEREVGRSLRLEMMRLRFYDHSAHACDESWIPEPPEMSPYPAYGYFITFSIVHVGYLHQLEEFLQGHCGFIRPESDTRYAGMCIDVTKF